MQNTTIHLPELYLKLIDEIKNTKDYPCLSEFIRIAIRRMLKRDFRILSNPLIKDSSKEVHKIVDKQQNTKFQRNMDQCRLLYETNSAIKERFDKNKKLEDRK